MNILVTGAAGLIGSNLSRSLLSDGHNVIAIDDMSGGLRENIPDCEFHQINCGSSLARIFRDRRIDYVYHLAAYAAEGLSPFIRKFNYTNNLVNTANIINHCLKYDVEKLIFTSSIAVYGKSPAPFSELNQPIPIDPYGVAKYACEMDIVIAHEQHGLNYTIFRPHNVFGVGQNIFDKYRNVLGIWMFQHLSGKPITIFGNGKQLRCFTPVQSIIGPMKQAMWTGSGYVVNLGSDKCMTINEASRELCDIIAEPVEVQFLDKRHEVNDARVDHNRLSDIFEYEHLSFTDALSEMWEWAKSLPIREQKVMGYEMDKNIYEVWKC